MTNETEVEGAESRLRSKVAILERLLEAYEHTALQQGDELHRERLRLELQRTLLVSQGEASLDGMLSVSKDGRILFVNRLFGSMWNLELPPVGAKCYAELVQKIAAQSRDPVGTVEALLNIADDERRSYELELVDGRMFTCFTAPIRGARGGLLGRLWQCRDISASLAGARREVSGGGVGRREWERGRAVSARARGSETV